MPPTISVMMPARNAERYIKPAVDSIVAQTWKDWELLIVDDGSTDSTRAIAQGYHDADARIIVLAGKGTGPGAARNVAVDYARGEYIVNMDADDIAAPDRLASLVSAARPYRDVVVGSNTYIVNGTKGRAHRSRVPLDNKHIRAGFERPIFRRTIIPQTILVSAALVKKARYNEFYKNLSDWDLIVRLAEDQTVVFANVADTLYGYRPNANSITTKSGQRITSNLLLRLNEHRRRRGLVEVTSIEEFETIVKRRFSWRLIYQSLYAMKRIQLSMFYLANRYR